MKKRTKFNIRDVSSIFDNRWFQRFVLPVAIWNTCKSWRLVNKEASILKDTINSNQDFYHSIGTLGFAPDRFGSLTAKMKYDPTLTLQNVKEIADKMIIAVIIKFVKDENLLGVIYTDCDLEGDQVVASIRPSTLPVLYGDLFDLAISTIVTMIISGSIWWIV